MINRHKPPIDTIDTYVNKLGYSETSSSIKVWIYTWNKMGYKLVSPDRWLHRLSICRGCPYWSESKNQHNMICTKCGCGSEKMLLLESHCPLTDPNW